MRMRKNAKQGVMSKDYWTILHSNSQRERREEKQFARAMNRRTAALLKASCEKMPSSTEQVAVNNNS